MLKQSRVLLLATLAIVLVTAVPASAIFAGQGQLPTNLTTEKMVELAQNAQVQVKSLIDSVYENDDALQKIADANLLDQLEGNVSLFNQGVASLVKAEVALEIADYSEAINDARETLKVFREVFKSINWILRDAGLRTSQVLDSQSLLDAVSRALDRLERLREILPSDATDQIVLLDQAEILLNLADAETLILEGKTSVVADNLSQANQLIAQVYEYLKLQAEEFNTVRICGYLQEMEQARERIRERIGYAGSQGLNVDGIFEALGYHNETDFMNTLQNMTQSAQGKIGDFTAVMHDLEALGQMVQQMDQTLTQEINRHQEQQGSGGSGTSGNDSGSPGTISGSGADSGAGSGSAGTSGSGTDSGTSGNTTSGTGTAGSGAGTSGSGTGTTDSGNGSGSPGTSGNGSGSGSSTGVTGSGTGSGGN